MNSSHEFSTDPESRAPPDRFCDLVMKGGITSGIVYPPAVCELAKKYRFKNIGGTSAGAIAAAVTAAAEYARRKSDTMRGFALLEELPSELGKADASGDTRLLRLFQPDAPCRRLFRILTSSLNAGGPWRRLGAALWGCVTAYWAAVLVSMILSTILGIALHSPHGGVFILLASLPALVCIWIYLDVTHGLVGNNYGMCKGMTTQPGAGDALTPWLHELIQDAAGLPLDEPLTFGHLWKAPGGPTIGSIPLDGRSIDLTMFTTNLSHGRPYLFPHDEPTARLFYKSEELAAYLPPEVMRWVNSYALEYEPSCIQPASDPKVERARQLGLKELPPPDKFPVLLAARMSLSFPVLFAAVPLWAIDYEHPRPERDFQRCMFSDGGISSNFPVHLFDGLVPLWPTFGINLEAAIPGFGNMTFLPHKCLEGIADRWTRFDQEQRSRSRFGGFLSSIISAMQNWNDNTLSRMPGVRDRVVRVRLEEDEGGMNLNMPIDVIRRVAERGETAAQELIDRFLEPAPNGWDGWSSQRWIRLDVLISALSQKTGGMLHALGPDVPHSASYANLIELASREPAPCHGAPLSPDQAIAIKKLVSALDGVATAFDVSVPSYPNSPLPEPDLRVRPPL